MKTRLVEFLICLQCQGPLQCVVEQEDPTLPWTEVLEGNLMCEQCGQSYSISRGIPRMMRGTLPDDVQKTVTGFYGISHCLGLMLYPCVRFVYQPVNEGKLPSRLSRILPYNEYLYYTSRLSYASLVSVIFDHLVPVLVTYLSKDELATWFPEDKFSSVTITSRNGMSWRARGIYMQPSGVEEAK
jgi:uncharacterized protein YbaR (Trm112 family)